MNTWDFKSGNKANLPEGSDTADNRYIPRWEVDNRIVYSLVDSVEEPHECRSRDISCNGACLLTRENIPADKRVNLKIYLTQNTAFDVEARIVWKQLEDCGYSMGVVFDEITPEIQQLILTYAFDVKKEAVLKHWFSGWQSPKDSV